MTDNIMVHPNERKFFLDSGKLYMFASPVGKQRFAVVLPGEKLVYFKNHGTSIPVMLFSDAKDFPTLFPIDIERAGMLVMYLGKYDLVRDYEFEAYRRGHLLQDPVLYRNWHVILHGETLFTVADHSIYSYLHPVSSDKTA